jgi:hypothetical protein
LFTEITRKLAAASSANIFFKKSLFYILVSAARQLINFLRKKVKGIKHSSEILKNKSLLYNKACS